MKTVIGPYKNFIGPYQIADKLFWWVKKYDTKFATTPAYDRVYEFGRWLSEDKNGNDSYLTKFCQWFDSKRKRKIKVKIDKWDSWNADSTLAIIILPLMKQLKETKHGSPLVQDEDVPDGLGLRSTEAKPKVDEWDTDENFHKRWEWVLSEIIWAFEQMHPDCEWEHQYRGGYIDFVSEPCKFDENGKPLLYEMKRGPKDTSTFDSEGYKKHSERIDNGLALFGKYYRGMWT